MLHGARELQPLPAPLTREDSMSLNVAGDRVVSLARGPDKAGRGVFADQALRLGLFSAMVVSSVLVFTIFGFLVYFSLPLLLEGRLSQLLSWDWLPVQGQYGIMAVVLGSFALTVTSVAVSYPAGVGICCFAHGLGPRSLRSPVLGIVHFMTSIPTVVYGFVSVFLLVPLLRQCFTEGTGFSWLAASLTLSVLVLPTIVLLIHTQMQQVDSEVRLAAKSLGLSSAQEMLWIVLPLSSRGLFAAAILGFGRALGDTIIALMVSGNAPQVPHSLLDSIRTLTAHIALVVATDVHSEAYQSLFACGLILFLVTAAINAAMYWIRARSQFRGDSFRDQVP